MDLSCLTLSTDLYSSERNNDNLIQGNLYLKYI